MSIIVALRYKDGIVMSADRQMTQEYLIAEHRKKIFKSRYSLSAYGVVGYGRDMDLIMANTIDILEPVEVLEHTEIDREYIITHTVYNWFDLLKRNGRLTIDNGMVEAHSSFMVCTGTKMFLIDREGATVEYNDYAVLGHGEQFVKGYMDTLNTDYDNLTETKAVNICKTAIQKACKDDLSISEEIDIIILENTPQPNEN